MVSVKVISKSTGRPLKAYNVSIGFSASFGKVSNSKDGEGIVLTHEEGKNPFMITF